MKDNDFKALTDYRLGQSLEALDDAEHLLKSQRYRAAVNRLYYAAFYAAMASLLIKRLQYAKHSAVIAFFDKEFIKTNILPKAFSRTLHLAFSERQQDDYIPFVEIDPQEVERLSMDVRKMIEGICEYIKNNALEP